MKIEVVNREGEKTGKKVELSKDIYGIEPNDHVLYLAVKQYLANHRQGTHKAKERNEVRGSTRKIKKQKGTGTARAGDIKNPIFRGGGVTFGPKPRDYTLKVNKKTRTLARKSALSQKARDKNIMVIEDFSFDSPKTGNMTKMLASLGLENEKVLFVMAGHDKNIALSCRNLKKTELAGAWQLNTYSIMNAQKLLISESSVKLIEEYFAS